MNIDKLLILGADCIFYALILILPILYSLLPISLLFTSFISTKYHERYMECIKYVIFPPLLWFALTRNILMHRGKYKYFSALLSFILCWLWGSGLIAIMHPFVRLSICYFFIILFLWFCHPIITIFAFILTRPTMKEHSNQVKE